jgi:WS/DGAT/MGAT family acyltransferase
MKQLTGLDAAFLYMEDRHQPQHIGSLGIYDSSTAPNGVASIETILRSIEDRAYLAPLMRQKLLQVPFDLDHPYWLRVESFKLEDHVHHLTLPDPGDWQQLCKLIAQLHEGPLDRSRPLWEFFLIEGLKGIPGIPGDASALYSKIHHAALDGVAVTEMALATHDLTPNGDIKPPPGPWSADPELPGWELLLRAQINKSLQSLDYIDFLKRSLPRVSFTLLGIGSGNLHTPDEAPRTRFNSEISPRRSFDGMQTSLDELRSIKASVPGATVNDVVLTLCGGALRKYLGGKNELPDQSLVAMAPINIRSKDREGTEGNQISEMMVSLHTEIDSARKRLQAVTKGTMQAKELTKTIGARTLTEYTQFAPAAATAALMRLAFQLGLTDMVQLPFNCVVTNVPGSPVPLYSLGSQLIQSWGLGPLQDGNGLFHAISSYCGDITITATSCPKMMPDPNVYMEGMKETLAELKSDTVNRNARVPRARKKTVRADLEAGRSKQLSPSHIQATQSAPGPGEMVETA